MNKVNNMKNNIQKEKLYDIKLTLDQCIALGKFLGDEGSERVEHLEYIKREDLKDLEQGYYDREIREKNLAKDILKILIKTTRVQIVSKSVLKYLEKGTR